MALTIDRVAIGCLPQSFIDKRGGRHRIERLIPAMHDALVAMYLAYKPRNSFQGLPPLRDEVCEKWVRDMLHTAVHVVAIGPGCPEMATNSERGHEAAGTEIVGHVALFPIDQRRCELLVVVSPQYQNVGLGTELTKTSLDVATELGFGRIWLPVDATNVRARRVYEKCGFEYLSRGTARELDMAHDLKPCPVDDIAAAKAPRFEVPAAQVTVCGAEVVV